MFTVLQFFVTSNHERANSRMIYNQDFETLEEATAAHDSMYNAIIKNPDSMELEVLNPPFKGKASVFNNWKIVKSSMHVETNVKGKNKGKIKDGYRHLGIIDRSTLVK